MTTKEYYWKLFETIWETVHRYPVDQREAVLDRMESDYEAFLAKPSASPQASVGAKEKA